MLDIKKLPKKVNEFNLFKKEEKGCVLYSYSQKTDTFIISKLEDFEIDKDFCVDEQAIKMLKLLSPITNIDLSQGFKISSKKGKYKTQFVDFSVPIMNDEYTSKISVNIDVLNKATNFVSTKPQRPCLCGVNVNSDGDVIATDSYIAMKYDAPNKDEIDHTVSNITLPVSFIKYLNDVGISGNVAIEFNEKNCMVQDENNMYITRLIAGNYPDMSKIISAKNDATLIEITYDDFKEKFDLATNIISEKGISQILTFNGLQFKSEGNDTYETELTVKNFNEMPEYKFSIQLNNLRTVINCINGTNNSINLYYIDSLKPIFVLEGQYTFLALPLRKQ